MRIPNTRISEQQWIELCLHKTKYRYVNQMDLSHCAHSYGEGLLRDLHQVPARDSKHTIETRIA